MDSISTIIQNIPLILEYFVPGYLMICLFRRLNDSNTEKMSDAIHIGISICISFLIKSTLYLIYHIPFIQPLFTVLASVVYIRFVVETLFGLTIVVLYIKIRRQPWVCKLFSKINFVTLSNNVFEGSELDRSQYVTVTTAKTTYYGYMILYDLNKECSWIVLDVVEQMNAEGNQKRSWLDHDYERYLIPMSDISDIIVHYTDTSRPIYPKNYEAMKEEERANTNSKH